MPGAGRGTGQRGGGGNIKGQNRKLLALMLKQTLKLSQEQRNMGGVIYDTTRGW